MFKNNLMLGRWTIPQFWAMLHQREQRMAKLACIESCWFFNPTSPNNCDSLIVVSHDDITVDQVFDETNAAIGEDWLWSVPYFYFVKHSDAAWFSLRWL